MDDYPVPVDTDLGSVYSNIERALYLMGFEGILHVCVDCKKLKYDQDKLFRTGRIGYLRNCKLLSLSLLLYLVCMLK